MHTAEPIPDKLRVRAERKLETGETIVWMGQPVPRAFTKTGTTLFFVGLFAIMGSAITIGPVVASMLIDEHPDPAILLFIFADCPFLLLGLFCVISPFIKKRIDKHSLYVITNRRFLKIGPLSFMLSDGFKLELMHDLSVEQNPDGSGNIVIESYAEKTMSVCSCSVFKFGLLRVRNIDEVEIILSDAIEHATRLEQDRDIEEFKSKIPVVPKRILPLVNQSAMPRELREAAERELIQDERILWMDSPIPRGLLKSIIQSLLFGIPWMAVTIYTICRFWIPVSGGHNQNYPLCLFSLLFFSFGFYVLASPYLDYRRTKHTVFAVTNLRVFEIDGNHSKTVSSCTAAGLMNLSCEEDADGSGNLIFNELEDYHNDDKHPSRAGFYNVRNVRKVEKIIREMVVAGVENRQ